VVPRVEPPSAGGTGDRLADGLGRNAAGTSNGPISRGQESQAEVETAVAQQVEQRNITAGAGQRNPRADAISRTDPSSLQGGQLPLVDGLELAGRMAEAHEQIGGEERNASWAPYMEQQILTYLGMNSLIAQQFSIPVMACRETMCEIQAVGYGPGGSFQTWLNETGPMLGEPWATDFGGDMKINTMPLAPGVQGIIVILTRESALRSAAVASAASL
jgi:hypothetical protein